MYKKVNSYNAITCIIERVSPYYSVLVFDNDRGLWVETFAPTRLKARKKAVCFFSIACKMY